jgi:glycosyltransferase involved in cell wall biosynthesis
MKISAIIPVYNGKKYLREAVDSVIKQRLQPIELIIIDDGSTDDSLQEINGIKAHLPIRVITKTNGGQSSARNLGACEAKGDFIALLDQDDVWYERHLEKLAEPFNRNPDLGFVYSNVDHTDEAGRVFNEGILNFCDFHHPQTQLDEMVRRDMYVLPSSTLICKKAFFDVGMFDERLSGYEDDDLFLRLFVKGWKKKYIPEPLSQWRIHSKNSGKQTGSKSRRIYAQKTIDTFLSSSLFKPFSCAEIIGVRFFHTTRYDYIRALDLKDYSKCFSLREDLIYYFKLTPLHFQKRWKFIFFLINRPSLFRLINETKKLAGYC